MGGNSFAEFPNQCINRSEILVSKYLRQLTGGGSAGRGVVNQRQKIKASVLENTLTAQSLFELLLSDP
jgi:hypothetical protein